MNYVYQRYYANTFLLAQLVHASNRLIVQEPILNPCATSLQVLLSGPVGNKTDEELRSYVIYFVVDMTSGLLADLHHAIALTNSL